MNAVEDIKVDDECGNHPIVSEKPLNYAYAEYQLYSAIKIQLLNNGWHTRAGSPVARFDDYPEITCGQGHGAICTVIFCKEDGNITKQIIFMVDKIKGLWHIIIVNNG